MAYLDSVEANAGSGGEKFAMDQYTDGDGNIKTMPYTALAFGAIDSQYTVVTTLDRFPVTIKPAAPKTAMDSSVAVAAGGTANLDSTQITSGKTGHLLQARASSSVPWKAELQVLTNGVASATKAVWFWDDPQPLQLPEGAITVAEDAASGVDGFRIVVTNLDESRTADLYAFFVWDEI